MCMNVCAQNVLSLTHLIFTQECQKMETNVKIKLINKNINLFGIFSFTLYYK